MYLCLVLEQFTCEGQTPFQARDKKFQFRASQTESLSMSQTFLYSSKNNTEIVLDAFIDVWVFFFFFLILLSLIYLSKEAERISQGSRQSKGGGKWKRKRKKGKTNTPPNAQEMI